MKNKAQTINELLEECPSNATISKSLIKSWQIINNVKYNKILCSISGGSDSDIMLDIIWRCDKDNKVDYICFDTGIEYQATKDHLKYLEQKYQIKINSYRSKITSPSACNKYGTPFISKMTSEYIQRLQSHNFQWENETFEKLLEKYPNCKAALMWWCNLNKSDHFNIRRNKCLKEFLIENNPSFKISSKCCQYSKKDLAHEILKKNKYELNIVGVRKAEGGIRATSYSSCFDTHDECDNFRPIFWYSNDDKIEYEKTYGVVHSKCYTEYGLKRTGCAGCPFGLDFESELNVIEEYEPQLYKAVNHIFADSYQYTRKYREFKNNK